MHFDIPTLLTLIPLQALALALMLPILMGWSRASRAVRSGQISLMLQAAAWVLRAINQDLHSLVLWLLILLFMSAALSALWLALRDWLGPRDGRQLIVALPIVLPIGVAISALPQLGGGRWGSTVADLGLSLQMMLVVWACAKPSTRGQDHNWRGLVGASFLALALVTLCRAGIAIREGGFLPAQSTHPIQLYLLLTNQIAVLASVMAILVAWRGETEAALHRLAQTDTLTGLSNRRAFASRAFEMISLARRYDDPLALMMLDLDHFKSINDTHGHGVGDQALVLFANCLQQVIRVGDLAGRVGGEEFCVLLTRSDAIGPDALDLRLRRMLAERSQQTLNFKLEFSAGWARLRPGDRNIEDVMRRADAALYEAKRSGRNRLVAEPGNDA
ncbi:MAG: GGDEF domain-containing protein [Burkholderiaceae bacterium]|nr:GGDEF domain-containing protein [Roseateles sp.]MBV8469520.1 GGDEF domain-containing protein [Burkholderiaceae bacterium]